MSKVIKVIVANVIINIVFVLLMMVLAQNDYLYSWVINGAGALYLAWLWVGTVAIATIILIVKK